MSKRRKNAQEEIKCRPTTAAFDLKVKVAEAEKLLLQGVNVKLVVSLFFKDTTTKTPLERAQAPIAYFIEHLQSGVPVGDPIIHGETVVQVFESGCPPPKPRAHNPNDDPPVHEDGDDMLPQYQLEVLVQTQARP